LFYQYGPFEDHRRLVASVIGSLMRGDVVDTTEGGQVRDFLHVEDVGSAIQAITEARLEGIVNVGSGVPVTVRQIVESLGNQLGKLELVNFGARPYNPTDPPFVVANNGRLKSETAWKQRYALDEGLANSIAWWKSR
jgi:nucleoside-diphosphate-sugar epimerase